jgi:hypothetical protein
MTFADLCCARAASVDYGSATSWAARYRRAEGVSIRYVTSVGAAGGIARRGQGDDDVRIAEEVRPARVSEAREVVAGGRVSGECEPRGVEVLEALRDHVARELRDDVVRPFVLSILVLP